MFFAVPHYSCSCSRRTCKKNLASGRKAGGIFYAGQISRRITNIIEYDIGLSICGCFLYVRYLLPQKMNSVMVPQASIEIFKVAWCVDDEGCKCDTELNSHREFVSVEFSKLNRVSGLAR